MRIAHDLVLSHRIIQHIHQLFELGLQIQAISINNHSSDKIEQELITLSQNYEQAHQTALEAGAPLQQPIYIKHMDDEYLFIIYEERTSYKRIHQEESELSLKLSPSIAVA